MKAVIEAPVSDRRKSRLTYLVLLAAFFINAVILFVLLPSATKVVASSYSLGFQDLYDQIAENLIRGNGYRVEAGMDQTMMREPGYPLFLAAVFKVGGYNIEAARLANLLLAFAIALMTMRLTQRTIGDRVAGVVAAVLFFVYPGTLLAIARGGVEISFICGVMLFMLFFYRAVEEGHLWRYGLAGAVLGGTALVRSEVLSFSLLLLAYLVLTAKGTSQRLNAVLRMAVLVLGMVVVILPWVIRNYRLTGEFVPTATVAGVAAQEGLYTCEHLSADKPFWEVQKEAGGERAKLAKRLGIPFEGVDYYQNFYDPKDEVVFNKALLKQVTAEYRREPALLAVCGGKNLLFNFWFLGKTWQATRLNGMIQVPLLALALGGVLVLWKRALVRRMGIILIFIFYVPAVHAPIIAHARHSIVIMPFLAILAGVSLVWIWNTYKAHVPTRNWGISAHPGLSEP